MCNKIVDNYPRLLKFARDCYMTQQMCDKVVNTQSSTTEFVPECDKSQKMCVKAFNECFLAFFYVIDQKKSSRNV